MYADSPHWTYEDGTWFCDQHELIAEQPGCPSCLAGDGDDDLEFMIEEIDEATLEAENFERRKLGLEEDDMTLFVPANIKNPRFRQA